MTSSNIVGVYQKRFSRLLLAAAAGSLGVVAVSPPAASAAQQCVSDGTAVAPVPVAQQMMNPDQVWPLSTGAGQRVAVIGTGLADNPLLGGQIAERTSLVPGAGADADCVGIGTAVAGLVAARRSDTVGFHGMAPGTQLLSVRVVGDEPVDSVAPDTLAAAIDWAVDHRAGVVAVATIAYQDSDALRQAVRRALNGNIVVVAPTGDLSQSTADATPYPAAYDGVLGVGAIGPDGTVAQTSRQRNVSLVAPGDVLSTYPRNGLGQASGTAFAAGYVAGAAALVRAYRPGLSGSDVVRRLLATATPAAEGTGSAAYGYGVVNPYQAVADEVTTASPNAVPGPVVATTSAAERERLADRERGNQLAYLLAGIGAAAAALLTAILVFGARGRRRRWRTGLVQAPHDLPENELPDPPVELFADRQG
jgi:membrane-anchored mycosin MYCP